MMKLSCLVMVSVFLGFGDSQMDCGRNYVHFEKIIGFRPVDDKAFQILYKNDTNAVTEECVSKCRLDKECGGFVLFYDTQTCFSVRNPSEISDAELIPDSGVASFTKICLKEKPCGEQLWTFERIPGAILVGNDTSILPDKVTRNQCQQQCISSKNFECRSTKFKIMDAYGMPLSGSRVKGVCVLSDADRHHVANGFRVARDNEEYLENECIRESEGAKNEFCAYEEYENQILQHIDVSYDNKTKQECESLCDNLKIFHCRGFSIYPKSTRYTCFLHSEDTKIYGFKLLKKKMNGFYYEKATCLNISVACSEDSMSVIYKPKINFRGKIYMQGYSDQPGCFVKGNGFEQLDLRLPIPSSQCGIIEAMSTDNRRLLSASLIIQYNYYIQTQGDRLIKVGCIFGNDSKLVVGTGVTVAPDNLSDGSSLIITSSSTPAAGHSTVLMKILDHNTKREVFDTQIGQELDLVIISEGPQDIWAGHLVAMTENAAESLILLDDKGCPVDNNVFPALNKYRESNRTILNATFDAFKFSSSLAVRFSVIVQLCPDKCPEVRCNSQIRTRRAEIETLNGTKIVNVNRSEFESINPQLSKKQLDIMVIVRSRNLVPDRLALGSGKVLVAGYNYETNEVCVDYSLLLGLVISWVLIQIVFAVACIIMVRKYKKYYMNEYMRQAYEEYNKNFEIGISNLDNRRVRWADSGDDIG